MALMSPLDLRDYADEYVELQVGVRLLARRTRRFCKETPAEPLALTSDSCPARGQRPVDRVDVQLP